MDLSVAVISLRIQSPPSIFLHTVISPKLEYRDPLSCDLLRVIFDGHPQPIQVSSDLPPLYTAMLVGV